MEDWSYLPPDFGGTPVVATYEFAEQERRATRLRLPTARRRQNTER
jgi:hypothetical protein